MHFASNTPSSAAKDNSSPTKGENKIATFEALTEKYLNLVQKEFDFAKGLYEKFIGVLLKLLNLDDLTEANQKLKNLLLNILFRHMSNDAVLKAINSHLFNYLAQKNQLSADSTQKESSSKSIWGIFGGKSTTSSKAKSIKDKSDENLINAHKYFKASLLIELYKVAATNDPDKILALLDFYINNAELIFDRDFEEPAFAVCFLHLTLPLLYL